MDSQAYPLTILHDGNCPICQLDMNNLKSRNDAGRLRFVDVSTPGFDPAAWGCTAAQLAAEIHARRADGKLVTGVEVFRLAYRGVGLGWVTAATGWPGVKPLADLGYRLFARHRPRLSRALRPFLETLLARQASRRSRACRDGICRLP